MKELIAISGKKNHGKDTLVKFIIMKYNDKYVHKYDEYLPPENIAFADPIKEAALQMLPQLERSDLWGPSQNRSKIVEGYTHPDLGTPLTIRDVLIDIGDLGRKYNENCWAFAAIKKAYEIRKTRPVIISDCRFKNELDIIERNNGKVIRVTRPEIGFTSNERSEIDLDDIHPNRFSKFIVNKNKEDLIDIAAEIVEEYFEI